MSLGEVWVRREREREKRRHFAIFRGEYGNLRETLKAGNTHRKKEREREKEMRQEKKICSDY